MPAPENLLDFRPDPMDPAFLADPYPVYERLRAAGPVVPLPGGGVWMVTGHPETQQVLTSPRFVKSLDPSAATAGGPGPDRSLSLLDLDPPDHTRIRSLVNRAFTPRVVEGMRTHIRGIAAGLIERMARGSDMDLVRDLAFPLPATVIAELLGVPVGDRDRFGALSRRVAVVVDMFQPEAVIRDGLAAHAELRAYLGDLVERQASGERSDFVRALLEAEEEGRRLDRGEVLALLALLLVAGHETTTNLIAVGTYTLLRDPARWAWLCAHRDAMATAVEELLRFEPPVQRDGRVVAEDLELGGRALRRGDFALCAIAAANRDPRVFERPGELDLTRRDNRHLSFGRGIHFCLGAPLARLEANLAFGVLTERLPDLSLEAEPSWRPNSILRSLRSLPVGSAGRLRP